MLLKDLIQKLTEISNLNSKWLDKEVYVQGTISYPELTINLVTKTDSFVDDHIIISEM